MKYINSENLCDYAFLNEDSLVYPVKAVCVCFHGYTDATMYSESDTLARLMGENGIAYVFPYYSVWAWMSKASQEFNEQVLDAVYERLSLNESVPLISSGGSMGGMTALNYLICGKRRVIGCALNCAVTDMNKIFEDFPTYRRAILSAHITEDGALSDIMRRYSPVGFVDKLPEIPYFFVYGENDPYFTKNQMPPIIEMFEERGLEFEVTVQPGMRHCDIESHPEAFSKYCEFITAIGSRNF